MKYSIWSGLICCFLLYWTSVPLDVITSAPRPGQPWTLESVRKYYKLGTEYALIQGVFSVLLDIYIFLLPIPIVLKLKLSSKDRLSVLGIFGTAIL